MKIRLFFEKIKDIRMFIVLVNFVAVLFVNIVVLGGNDPTALGILASLQMNQMQDKGILIYGIDGSPDGKVMINEGYFEGSSAQRPLEMAEIAVDMAYDYMNGKETESLVIVPVTLITLDNIDEFDLAGWQ